MFQVNRNSAKIIQKIIGSITFNKSTLAFLCLLYKYFHGNYSD